MSEEITDDQALEALVDNEKEIVTEADQNLPRLEFGIRQYEDAPRYKAPLSGERQTRYDRWKVDEALTTLQSAVGSWAEENGYRIDYTKTEAFDEPIDEQLIANLEGEIDTGDGTIDFGFYGGRMASPLGTSGFTRTDEPGDAITVFYDSFDGSMTEEYRELNAITEAALERHGQMEKNEPDFL